MEEIGTLIEKILKITGYIGTVIGYVAIGIFMSLFANDSGKLSNFKVVIISIFWLPLMILTVIGFSKPLNRWFYGKDN